MVIIRRRRRRRGLIELNDAQKNMHHTLGNKCRNIGPLEKRVKVQVKPLTTSNFPIGPLSLGKKMLMYIHQRTNRVLKLKHKKHLPFVLKKSFKWNILFKRAKERRGHPEWREREGDCKVSPWSINGRLSDHWANHPPQDKWIVPPRRWMVCG